MRIFFLLSMLMVSACAKGPALIKSETMPLYSGISAGHWQSAALCAARLFEETGDLAHVREDEARQHAEVVAQMVGGQTIVTWMADFTQEGTRVQKTLWRSPSLIISPVSNEEMAARIAACR